MRRSDKAITVAADIEQILKAGRVCQLALKAEPAPYLVSLNYGYHQGELFFHSAGEGRKLDLLREDPRVGFCVALDHGLVAGEKACDWSTRFQSVVGHGRIVFLETLEEKRQGLDRFMAHYSPAPFGYPEQSLAATRVYKLIISDMSAKQSRMA